MDIATLIGMALGVGLLLAGIGPANLGYFIDVPSMLMVLEETISSMLINFPARTVLSSATVVEAPVLFTSVNLIEEINRMVEFATIARRDGLLALEEKLEDLKDPFLLRGIQMIIDGVAPETVRAILNIELNQMATPWQW